MADTTKTIGMDTTHWRMYGNKITKQLTFYRLQRQPDDGKAKKRRFQ